MSAPRSTPDAGDSGADVTPPKLRVSSPAATVTTNAAVLTALKLGSPALSMIVVLAISRVLGTEGLGRYTLALTYLGAVTTVTTLGLNALLMREGGRDRAGLPDLLANAVTVTAAASLLAVPLMLAFARWAGYDAGTELVLAVMSLGILPATVLILCDAVFIARQRTVYIGVYTVVDALIRVGVATVLLELGFSVVAIVATVVASQIAAVGVAGYLVARLGAPLRPAFDRVIMKRLFRAAPTFVSLAVLGVVNWRTDLLMLSAMGSLRDVGLYAAAYRIFDLVRLLPQNLCMAVYPLVAQAALTDPLKVRVVGGETLRLLLMAMLPIAAGGTFVGGPLLALMFGEEFRSGGLALALLLWTAIPYAFVRHHVYVVVGSNREHVDLGLSVGMAIATVGLNLALVPRFGATGAALATLVAVSGYGIGQYVYLKRCLPGHLARVPRLGRLLAATALMALFVWTRQSDPVALRIGLASVVYVAALLLTGAVSTRELRRLRTAPPQPSAAAALPPADPSNAW